MKRDFKIESLKKTALFSSLTSQELQQIREEIVIKHFKKNVTIFHEENASEYMYLILEGEVKVTQITDTGKEIILSVHQTGDFFGELSLIDGKTAPATVSATRNSVIAIISRKDFYSILYGQSKVLDNLLRILCGRLRESMKKIQLMNFNNATQRLKMLFLMLSESYGEESEEGTLLKIKLIHQDIAAMTGLTRETVTRILDRWKRSGEIQILQNKFILLKPQFETIYL
ncbi:MAG TPA: Crp/Fnr family transcriptional regulator [Nitrospirota bacterium]